MALRDQSTACLGGIPKVRPSSFLGMEDACIDCVIYLLFSDGLTSWALLTLEGLPLPGLTISYR